MNNKDIALYCVTVLGLSLVAMTGESTPEVMVALGSAAIGGLAGLLAPSPLNR